MAGRLPRPRPGGAAQAGGGRGAGAALLPARRPARRPGSRASQECGREGGAAGVGSADPPYRSGRGRSPPREAVPPRLASCPGDPEPGAPLCQARSGSSRWPLGRGLRVVCGLSPPALSRSCPLRAVCFSFVCAFPTSRVLGGESGGQCVITPRGDGGSEEVKNVP